jgi:hypothetical protein
VDGPEYSGVGEMLTGVISPHPAVAGWFDYIHSFPWTFWQAFVAVGVVITTINVTAISVWRLRKQGRSSSSVRREPPWLAESLLCIFARAKDIDALMGDFEELFTRDCASGMPHGRAVARYWARVLRSLWPQMWQAIRRVGLLGLIAAALKR